jgi:hypothetical protein
MAGPPGPPGPPGAPPPPPPPDRPPEQIRQSVEATREELRYSLVDLQGKIKELSDWRAPLRRNRRNVVVGAALAGFVVGGGVAAAVGLLRRR